ncbi:MAG: hypothetical protein C5B59_15065 [Bacteroidetes bacterium]|nr:MAG: hypothetical protein C5B59_15065 [Bacteroidota bacterium]
MKWNAIRVKLPKQIQSVELLRGIASSMVCYFHLARGNTNFLADDNFVKKMATWGWSGVQIFFVISGFVIPYAMFQKKYTLRNFFTFLKKRIIRIEPPYLISIVLIIVLAFVSTLSPLYRGAPFHIDLPNLLGHIAYLNVFTGQKWLNDVYWSLAIEFQYYLLIAVSYGLIVSKKIYIRQGFLFLFLLSSFWLKDLGFVFVYATYFISGILLFQLVSQLISFTEYIISTVCVIGVLEFQQGTVLSLIVIGTILVILFVNRVPAFFRFMGMISYSLYLIHVPIGGRIINITEVKTGNMIIRELMVPVAFAGCVLAAWIYYRLFEKRFKMYSSSIKYAGWATTSYEEKSTVPTT